MKSGNIQSYWGINSCSSSYEHSKIGINETYILDIPPKRLYLGSKDIPEELICLKQ